MASQSQVRVFPTPQALFDAAAQSFVQETRAAVTARGRFTVALSGGSTPKGLFQVLATTDHDALPWDRMFFFWGDERHVPPNNVESNYRMVMETLLSKVPVPPGNIFRVPAEDRDANQAASEYETVVRDFFGLGQGQFPRFDLILLGMGPDGHCASLFPQTAALQEKTRVFLANWVPKLQTYRLTFSAPVLNNARNVEFLVAGADKAPALREVLEGQQNADLYPSKLIKPADGNLVWMVDQAAAQNLSPPRS